MVCQHAPGCLFLPGMLMLAGETERGELSMEEELRREKSSVGTVSETADLPSAGEETPFRPITRSERRNLWLREYEAQDFALQMWVDLVEKHDLELEVMLQMHGLLVFGVLIS